VATRSIITHQPEVSCDLCGRRLLRGERPDVFLDAGDRRTVCELCTLRAADEGWLRASGAVAEPSALAPRARRGRSILERLRQRREVASLAAEPDERVARRRRRRSAWEHDLEDAWEPQPAAPALVAERHVAGDGEPAAGESAAPGEPAAEAVEAGAVEAGSPIALAIEIFNASECAARVAGIARALGDPSVTVRVAGDDRVSVVVAWELCWYRYEVDLSEAPATIGLLADGSELDELEQADRLPNASANERGELTLLR
jgi:hypothetical protein